LGYGSYGIAKDETVGVGLLVGAYMLDLGLWRSLNEPSAQPIYQFAQFHVYLS
jgi:hypothetical protein